MATDNPRGLVYLKSLDGNPVGNTRTYPVSAGNPTSIFIGDPVRLVGGHVRVVSTSGMSAGEPGVLGVVDSLYNSNGRPLTFNQPTGGPFLDASTAGFANVHTDPNATFLISSDATAVRTNIGQFVAVSAAGANSAAGISGFLAKMSTATDTKTTTAQQYMIIGVGPNEKATGGTGDTVFTNNQDLEVLISDHLFKRSVVVTGTASVATG